MGTTKSYEFSVTENRLAKYAADLGLGCELPTQFAGIKKGDVVIDLGSGAGNDAFTARHQTVKVVGIDLTRYD